MIPLLRHAGWIAVVLVGVLSLVPSQFRPHLLPSGQVEHMLAYAIAGALLAGNHRNARRTIAICVAFPLAAASFELLQNWVPGRDPKVSDVIASSTGAWIGIAFAVWLRNLTAGEKAEFDGHAVLPNGSPDPIQLDEEEDDRPASAPASNPYRA
jgi:hypothetical protein